jgi:hypothetical protein
MASQEPAGTASDRRSSPEKRIPQKSRTPEALQARGHSLIPFSRSQGRYETFKMLELNGKQPQ